MWDNIEVQRDFDGSLVVSADNFKIKFQLVKVDV